MWYILDENNLPIKVSVFDAVDWLENNDDKVRLKQEHIGDIYISTVFLGLDHAFNGEIPLLWETMIFGGENDQYQERYSSYEDALDGHQKAVELVKNSKK